MACSKLRRLARNSDGLARNSDGLLEIPMGFEIPIDLLEIPMGSEIPMGLLEIPIDLLEIPIGLPEIPMAISNSDGQRNRFEYPTSVPPTPSFMKRLH